MNKKSLFICALIVCSMCVVQSMEVYRRRTLKRRDNNNRSLLFKLLKHPLYKPFSYCLVRDSNPVISLKKSLHYFMQLRTLCKNFSALWTYTVIGNLVSCYALDTKNAVLQDLMETMRSHNYNNKRFSTLVLLYAGVDPNTKTSTVITEKRMCSCLLENAVIQDDLALATILFDHGANPNIYDEWEPIFFHAKTEKMAQLCLDKGAKINAMKNYINTNVLWHVIKDEYPATLMQFYLNKKANPKLLNLWDNSCLFHSAASIVECKDIDNYLKKVILLLDAIPDMVNTPNSHGLTPMDVAHKSLKERPKQAKIFIGFIKLLKKNNGKTAKEIKFSQKSYSA